MEINRRAFLTMSAAGVAGAAALAAVSSSPVAGSSGAINNTKSSGMLVDTTLCVGCRACVVACKQWNHNPVSSYLDSGNDKLVNSHPLLDAATFTNIRATQTTRGAQPLWVYTKIQCMHCAEPACAAACPVAALRKTENGPVIYDKKRCIGCRYCMTACPFGIPTFEWSDPMPWIKKCTFCADRQNSGLQPACAGTCPTGALKFGARDELLAVARKRIADNPGAYQDHIYGETEIGGTSWLYLAAVPFAALGFPLLRAESVTVNAKRAMNLVPPVLVGMAALMSGAYFITRHKEKNAPGTDSK